MLKKPSIRPLSIAALSASVFASLLCACGTAPNTSSVYQNEQFGTARPFSRNYAMSVAATCEAARRALLSQGYLVHEAKADRVDGHKSFQPEVDNHVEIEFHVVCVIDPNGPEDNSATAFVNALQERYALKKTSQSASVGVGAVGSVSLPFGSSDDSLVKIGSETIPAGEFYDRFFDLLEHYLPRHIESGHQPGNKPEEKNGAPPQKPNANSADRPVDN